MSNRPIIRSGFIRPVERVTRWKKKKKKTLQGIRNQVRDPDVSPWDWSHYKKKEELKSVLQKGKGSFFSAKKSASQRPHPPGNPPRYRRSVGKKFRLAVFFFSKSTPQWRKQVKSFNIRKSSYLSEVSHKRQDLIDLWKVLQNPTTNVWLKKKTTLEEIEDVEVTKGINDRTCMEINHQAPLPTIRVTRT